MAENAVNGLVIDRIWSRMRALWGARFDREWEAPACPDWKDPKDHAREYVQSLRNVWITELSGMTLESIKYGLEHLPSYPCTLLTFKEICFRRPEKNVPRLPPPPADPAKANDALRKSLESLAQRRKNPRAWVLELQERRDAGEIMSPMQRRYLREMGCDKVTEGVVE